MEQKAGGMSKGCLIGIIIASALLLLLVVSLITCYIYREDIAKFGSSYTVNTLKPVAALHPEIVDTVKFDFMIDEFNKRLSADSLNWVKWDAFRIATSSITKWVEDKKLDTSEIVTLSDAIVAYYPELDSLRPIRLAPSENKTDTTQAAPADTSSKK